MKARRRRPVRERAVSKPKLRRVRRSMFREHFKLYSLALRLKHGWELTPADRERAASVLQAVCDGDDLVSRYFEPWTGQAIPPQQLWIAADYFTATGTSKAKDTARRWGISPERVRAIATQYAALKTEPAVADLDARANLREYIGIQLSLRRPARPSR